MTDEKKTPDERSEQELEDLELPQENADQVKGGEAVPTENISLNRK